MITGPEIDDFVKTDDPGRLAMASRYYLRTAPLTIEPHERPEDTDLLRVFRAGLSASVASIFGPRRENSSKGLVRASAIEGGAKADLHHAATNAHRLLFPRPHEGPDRCVELMTADCSDAHRAFLKQAHGVTFNSSPSYLGMDRAESKDWDFLYSLSENARPTLFHENPLWYLPGNAPDKYQGQTGYFYHALAEPHWSFWREWYQGFLDGTPLDWELQRCVATIPDAEWAMGPGHIAKLIEEIRARFALERRVADLEEELKASAISRHSLGGNFPPEPIDPPGIAKELLIIWEPLQDLKAELEAEKPDEDRIRKALALLADALKAGLAWCAKKADLAGDTTIKWAIPAGGTGYFALNPEKLSAVIDGVQTWLGILP